MKTVLAETRRKILGAKEKTNKRNAEEIIMGTGEYPIKVGDNSHDDFVKYEDFNTERKNSNKYKMFKNYFDHHNYDTSDFNKRKGAIIDNDNNVLKYRDIWKFIIDIELNKEEIKKKNNPRSKFNLSTLPVVIKEIYDKHNSLEYLQEFFDGIEKSSIQRLLDIYNYYNYKYIDGNVKDKENIEKELTKHFKMYYIPIEIKQKNIYLKEVIHKPNSFLNKLFHIDDKGYGKGEIFICYLIKGAVMSGGNMPYDININNSYYELKYEVKHYPELNSIRIGNDSLVQSYDIADKLKNTIKLAYQIHEIIKGNPDSYINDIGFIDVIEDIIRKDDLDAFNRGEFGKDRLIRLENFCLAGHYWIKTNVKENIVHTLTDIKTNNYIINGPMALYDDLIEVGNIIFNRSKINAILLFNDETIKILEAQDIKVNNISQGSFKIIENNGVDKPIKIYCMLKQSITNHLKNNNLDHINDPFILSNIYKNHHYYNFFNFYKT